MTSGVEDCCDLLQMQTDIMMVDNGGNGVANSVISVTMPGASSPTSMLHNNGAINTQSIADYLAQLLKDKKQLAALPNVFHHVERLLDEGEFWQRHVHSVPPTMANICPQSCKNIEKNPHLLPAFLKNPE